MERNWCLEVLGKRVELKVNKPINRVLPLLPVLCATLLSVCWGGKAAPLTTDLTVSDDVARYQSATSMVGFRDKTLLFYTFKQRRAVLKLVVDRKTVSGTLYIFSPQATPEGLAKWVNNQHSDGLFVDPAQPVGRHNLPAEKCRIKSSKLVGQVAAPNGEFNKYNVSFSISESEFETDEDPAREFRLGEFSGTSQVHAKAE
jgi:hypothetical protein